MDQEIKEYAQHAMNELLCIYGYDESIDTEDMARHLENLAGRPKTVDDRRQRDSVTSESPCQQMQNGFKFEPKASLAIGQSCYWCFKAPSILLESEEPSSGDKLSFCSADCLNQYKMSVFRKETEACLKNLHGGTSAGQLGSLGDSLQLGEARLITPELWGSQATAAAKECARSPVSSTAEHEFGNGHCCRRNPMDASKSPNLPNRVGIGNTAKPVSPSSQASITPPQPPTMPTLKRMLDPLKQACDMNYFPFNLSHFHVSPSSHTETGSPIENTPFSQSNDMLSPFASLGDLSGNSSSKHRRRNQAPRPHPYYALNKKYWQNLRLVRDLGERRAASSVPSSLNNGQFRPASTSCETAAMLSDVPVATAPNGHSLWSPNSSTKFGDVGMVGNFNIMPEFSSDIKPIVAVATANSNEKSPGTATEVLQGHAMKCTSDLSESNPPNSASLAAPRNAVVNGMPMPYDPELRQMLLNSRLFPFNGFPAVGGLAATASGCRTSSNDTMNESAALEATFRQLLFSQPHLLGHRLPSFPHAPRPPISIPHAMFAHHHTQFPIANPASHPPLLRPTLPQNELRPSIPTLKPAGLPVTSDAGSKSSHSSLSSAMPSLSSISTLQNPTTNRRVVDQITSTDPPGVVYPPSILLQPCPFLFPIPIPFPVPIPIPIPLNCCLAELRKNWDANNSHACSTSSAPSTRFTPSSIKQELSDRSRGFSIDDLITSPELQVVQPNSSDLVVDELD